VFTNTFFTLPVTCSYCPSVLILGPGQHLVINKTRLHMFRKLTFDELDKEDCHCLQRAQLVQKLRDQAYTKAPLCVSIAYDW
jgi:hypothetical protein